MSGQLGFKAATNSCSPQAILGPWKSPSGSSLVPSKVPETSEVYIKNVNIKFL